MLFADFEQKVKDREVNGMPQDKLSNVEQQSKRHVQAYYGLFLKHYGTELPISEDQCFDYAVRIDAVVRKSVAEYSINPQEIENQITIGLLPLLFQDLGVEKAQVIISDVIQITRLGLAGYKA